MVTDQCFIWQTPAKTLSFSTKIGADLYSARVGGDYRIGAKASKSLNGLGDDEKLRLTTWLIDQRRFGVSCPEITTDTLNRIKNAKQLSVTSRADRLLIHMRNQTTRISTPFCFSRQQLNNESQSWQEAETFSQMKAWTESLEWDELGYLIQFLEESGLIRRKAFEAGKISQGPFAGHADYYEHVITPSGFSRLADIESKSVDSKQAFIAMWFDNTMNTVWKAIADAVRDAGYAPLRIDRKEHNNKIDDEIIAEIRRSRFVVADFTHGDDGMRGGVYYEAGFARGMGLEVISTCRSDLLSDKKIHFDTRQYNHIGWTEGALSEFQSAISNRIPATIGDGPLKASA